MFDGKAVDLAYPNVFYRILFPYNVINSLLATLHAAGICEYASFELQIENLINLISS